jgi:hypothetical protein
LTSACSQLLLPCSKAVCLFEVELLHSSHSPLPDPRDPLCVTQHTSAHNCCDTPSIHTRMRRLGYFSHHNGILTAWETDAGFPLALLHSGACLSCRVFGCHARGTHLAVGNARTVGCGSVGCVCATAWSQCGRELSALLLSFWTSSESASHHRVRTSDASFCLAPHLACSGRLGRQHPSLLSAPFLASALV